MLSLSNLKQWLMQNKTTTIRDLQMVYNEDPKLLYNMLQHFIARGQLLESTVTPKCGSQCNQCPIIFTLRFEWQA